MIDHLGLSVKDGPASKRFFVEALKPLGIGVVMEFGEHVGFGDPGKPYFWMGPGSPAAPVHLAFGAKDRPAVDAFYRAAIAAGGKDNGPPGIRAHYHPNYYGAFVFDPDGNNIEAVCHLAPGAVPARATRPTARKAAARKSAAKPSRPKATKGRTAKAGKPKAKKASKARGRR